jgi:hypothetical protein
MSHAHFDDECVGCRPAMVDIETGRVYADDTLEMTIVNRLWSETTLGERQAWHRVTCQNSRSLVDMQFAKAFADRLEAAFALVAKKKGRPS